MPHAFGCVPRLLNASKRFARADWRRPVFGKCLLRISVMTLAVLYEILCVYLVPQANARVVRRLGDDVFLPNHFQFIVCPVIRLCDSAVK
jgi:hypothetical protein